MLQLESIQFCGGLSTQGDWPAATCGAHAQIPACLELTHLGLLVVCTRRAFWSLFARACISWTHAKIRKSMEAYPHISSLICFHLVCMALGRRWPSCWHCFLTQSLWLHAYLLFNYESYWMYSCLITLWVHLQLGQKKMPFPFLPRSGHLLWCIVFV